MNKGSFLLYFFSVILIQGCSSSHYIAQSATQQILKQQTLESAHIGISIYDATSNSFLYNYQGDKYFIPASNTKLFSLYAGMKYLGDSLIGIRYIKRDSDILVLPTGDPTLLHRDFLHQPIVDFLKDKNVYLLDPNWREKALGAGWSWDDYNDDYMVERSAMPVYGNFIQWVQVKQPDGTFSNYSIPDVNWKVKFSDTTAKGFFVKRNQAENFFTITQGKDEYKEQDVPFVTNGLESAVELLRDSVNKNIFISNSPLNISRSQFIIIHSRPADSMFKPMMYRSDNFFAEQTLLMVSNERLGIMKDERIIDTLLKTDLKELPQKPVWVDGSGLSRYNLFSPQDFVWLLNMMKNEFGFERMKSLLPTGSNGTLGIYYKEDSGRIYAKTGSLSGVICLTGYLITRKDHVLVFSVLVNNHNGSGSIVRKAVAGFLNSIIYNY
jgi:D-alanyl-D-alanine carboxypeptidase/D-alanyl-D-alanine-endopeptidase (penicillin-binding protein 4)